MALLNELTEDRTRLPFSQEQIDRTRYGYDRDLYPDVNWLDQITKDYAYSTRANLTVSGGSDFLRYSLVGSYSGVIRQCLVRFHNSFLTEIRTDQ